MRNLFVGLTVMILGGTATQATAAPEPAHAKLALTSKADVRVAMDRQLDEAVLAERQANARVFYFEQKTVIAERDLAAAEIRLQTAERAWDTSVKLEDPRAAGRWARAHARALAEEREALGRLTLDRAERDMARVAFQARVDELHQIATRAGRINRTRG